VQEFLKSVTFDKVIAKVRGHSFFLETVYISHNVKISYMSVMTRRDAAFWKVLWLILATTLDQMAYSV